MRESVEEKIRHRCNMCCCQQLADKCKICECGLDWHPLCCRGQDYSNPCQATCEGHAEFPLLTCQHGTWQFPIKTVKFCTLSE